MAILKRDRAIAQLTGALGGDGGDGGDAWVFPSGRDARLPMPRPGCCALWAQLAMAVKLPTGGGYGWHWFRTAFANRLRNAPLRDLKDLGAWKTEKTGVSVYQAPSEDAQRACRRRSTRARVPVPVTRRRPPASEPKGPASATSAGPQN